jgi:hypothetical protein
MATHCRENLCPEIGPAFLGSGSVMENSPQGVTVAGSHLVHSMAHLHTIVTSRTAHGSVIGGEYHAVFLVYLSIDHLKAMSIILYNI